MKSNRRLSSATLRPSARQSGLRRGCPICLELLRPQLRIFQCTEGCILCKNCKENPALVHCPQCWVSLERNCSRNRALEEVARNFFPPNTMMDLKILSVLLVVWDQIYITHMQSQRDIFGLWD